VPFTAIQDLELRVIQRFMIKEQMYMLLSRIIQVMDFFAKVLR
jgi:hypothetical protein